MTALWQDARYALRMLARNPGFSATVIVILALGIGANTSIFSVADAVLFRPWPCVEPERIVSIWEQDKSQDTVRFGSSARNIAYWREHSAAFEYVGVCQNFHACLTGTDRRRYVDGSAVSPSFFRIMGVQPLLGRDFAPEEELAGHENVVILSHALWVERFARDREAIGKTLSLDNKEYTVIGVMPGDLPRAVTFGAPFWVPVALKPDETGSGGSTFARLNRGVTVEQARANLGVLMEQLAEIDPRMVRGNEVRVERLLDRSLGGCRVELYLLWGAAALVLLVACANAACLFLGHASVRQREIAVRAMLGASRIRLVRQLLIQGMALSAIAAALGVLTGAWTLKGLLWICPAYMPRIDESRVDASVLVLALGLVTLTGVIFSLIPAWRVSDARLCQSTKTRAAGLSTRSREGRLQGTLIVAQIAVALTLLTCVGIFVRGLFSMYEVDLGFDPQNVVMAAIDLPEVKYPQEHQWQAFCGQLLDETRHLPDVQSAALASCGFYVVSGRGYLHFSIEGRPPDGNGELPMACIQMVTPDFIRTMGIPIVEGRDFSERDVRDGARCVLINECLARRHFDGIDPIGKCINGLRVDGMPIVGVVRNVRDYGQSETDLNVIYTLISNDCFRRSDLYVRTSGRCEPLIETLRARIAALDPDLETPVCSLEENLSHISSTDRFIGVLFGLFSQVALLLAAVGLYGSVQYAVTQHTHEIGVRMAIGAARSSVASVFLCRGVRLVSCGTGLGLLGGYIASRIMASLFYEAKATDFATLIGATATLFAVALVACYIPARRAAKVDPMVALRYE